MAKKVSEKNYAITEEAAKALRLDYLLFPMRDYVRKFMNDFPETKTVTIKVAQYYDDEANDAVHFRMYPSVLDTWWDPAPPAPYKDRKGREHTPEPEDYYYKDLSEGEDARKILEENVPFFPFPPVGKERDYHRYGVRQLSDLIRNWETERIGWGRAEKAGWEDNGAMIPLFAGFCQEDSGRNHAYTPLCIYRREKDGMLALGDVSMEFVGKLHRPELDRIQSESEGDDTDSEENQENTFTWITGVITDCKSRAGDPLADIRHHFQREDVATREEERLNRALIWTTKGPAVRTRGASGSQEESTADRLVKNDAALLEIQAEWDRRKAFDAAFVKKHL